MRIAHKDYSKRLYYKAGVYFLLTPTFTFLTEFLGHKVQNLFKSHLIRHFVTQNKAKASYAERATKTNKGKIYKYFTYKQSYHYIDALQDITQAYNSSVHRSIKMTPAQVTMSNLNSERIKNEERMKKALLSLKLWTLSGSHVPE